MEMEFREYLIKKKIDPEAFKDHEPEAFVSLQTLFSQIHPESFTMQKLFLINIIRRKYQLPAGKKEVPSQVKLKAKPLIKSSDQTKSDKPGVRSGRPVMKKPAVRPEASPDEDSKKKKPVVGKPVIKPKQSGEVEKKHVAKPQVKRPVIKPKVNKEEGEEVRPKAKPVIKKLVVKPKITTRGEQKKEGKNENPSSKPLMKKPVIKPKIQPKKNKDE